MLDFKLFSTLSRFRAKSLRTKIILSVLPPVTIGFLVISLVSGILSYRDMKQEILQRYDRQARDYLQPLKLSLWDMRTTAVQSQMSAILNNPDISGVKVVETVMGKTFRTGEIPDDESRSGYLIFSAAIVYNESDEREPLGTLHLYMKKKVLSNRVLDKFFKDFLLFLSLLIIVVTSSLFSYHRTINIPLDRLIRSIRRYDARKSMHPVKWTADDEMGEVISAYNGLIVSLEMGNSQLVRALDKARKANEVKGEFLANMSHEIRTPLNGIQGMAELVLDSGLAPEQKKYVEIILTESELLLAIVNDILDFSKIEAGKMVLEKIPFDLGRTIDHLFTPLEIQANKKGVSLSRQYDLTGNEAVVGDPVRLRQILINLIGNSIKFTFEGDINLGIEHLRETAQKISYRFSVADTGIGIPKEKQSEIFDSFSQADGSTTRRFGGTGLGISISNMLVKQMGGTLKLSSEPDKGTRFYFDIEFTKFKGRPETITDQFVGQDEHSGVSLQPTVDFGLLNGKKFKILLAEDYETNQQLATHQLESFGFHVTLAGDGQKAVDFYSRDTFDIVLMDIQMPKMDGYSACRRIREMEEESGRRKTPVIAMTAHALDGYRQKCIVAGMDDYITKPLKKDVLLSTVKKWTQANKDTQHVPGIPEHRPNHSSEAVMDLETALKEFGNDEAFFLEVFDGFLSRVREQLLLIEQAAETADFSTISKEAHAIKGGAANLAAVSLSRAAHDLEILSIQKNTDSDNQKFQEIKRQFDRLASFRKKLKSPLLPQR